jgi:two-component system, NarL family, response regulator LiaR
MQLPRLMKSSSQTAASRKPTSAPAIALLSDHTLFREGVVKLLNQGGYQRVAEYDNSGRLLATETTQPPAVVIVDLDHESEDTLTLLQRLRHALPQSHVVAIGTALRHAAADTGSGVETPAATGGDLAKATADDRRLSLTVLRELRRWQQVTRRQRAVMRWLAVGLDNHTIAGKLKIGDRAVKAHVTKMLDTFHLSNRTQLALLAQRAGLLPPRREDQAASQPKRP